MKKTEINRLIEKEWGNQKMLIENKACWAGPLGEKIVKEILLSYGKSVKRPKIIMGHKPDWETEDAIYEVKTRNYTTPGTIGEKVLGTPYKYAEIPDLYGKPLIIVLVAFQEYEADNSFHLFGGCNIYQQKMIDMWRDIGITYVKCSDLLKNIS